MRVSCAQLNKTLIMNEAPRQAQPRQQAALSGTCLTRPTPRSLTWTRPASLTASSKYPGRSNPTQQASSAASNRLPSGGTRFPRNQICLGFMGANCGSQRAQILPDPPRRLQNVTAGGRLPVRLPQTTPDAGFAPGGQGVAGSNPAVPTGNRVFSNIFAPHQSHQKSHSPSKRPSQRRAPIMFPGVLPAHLSSRQVQGSRPVKGSNIAEPPRPCTAPGSSSHRDPFAAEVVDPAQQRYVSGHASIVAERKT